MRSVTKTTPDELTQIVKEALRKAEEPRKMPEPPPDEFAKMGEELAAAMAQRRADEASINDLLIRKAEAEKKIQNLAQERLSKARKLGDNKALDAIIEHFIMGGADIRLALKENLSSVYRANIVTVQTKNGITRNLSILDSKNVNLVLVASRTETNPLFPVFLVVNAEFMKGLPHGEQVQVITDKLTEALKKNMRSYMVVRSEDLNSIDRNAI